MSPPSVSPRDFADLAKYIREVSGIVLDARKTYLVETRLGPLLPSLGCADYAALYRKARADLGGAIRLKIIDAISTQETSFFRDIKPFELLRQKLLPDHFARNAHRTLRVWCAASSTGQEIYSVAMTIKEAIGDLSAYDVSILGTDISPAALNEASLARYGKLALSRGLSALRLRTHFFKIGEIWQIQDELRAMARFLQLNLLLPLVGMGTFDLILCRNVAIYFSTEDRKRLFERLTERLKPGGVLLIGSSESLSGVTDALQRNEALSVPYYTRRQ